MFSSLWKPDFLSHSVDIPENGQNTAIYPINATMVDNIYPEGYKVAKIRRDSLGNRFF
jgi:hypothetical protein